MRFDVVTLFPEMVLETAGYGVTGKAITQNVVGLSAWNPRDYTHDKHRTVDDRPYGGGPGMVMKCQPLADAVNAARQVDKDKQCKVVYLSPQGKQITQDLLTDASQLSQLILVAGRYEGIDERFIESVCDEEWSLGDYVISGGELAALVVIDAVTRLIPGVLGDEESATQDSFMNKADGLNGLHRLLDTPHYTRPEKNEFGAVPDVLLAGNHKAIQNWRNKQAIGRTELRRPDLMKEIELNAEQEALLKEFRNEVEEKG